LAIDLAESGEAEEAWQTWESWLARGLLDEISARDSRTMSEKDRAREAYLARQLEQIDEKILRLASLPGALDSPPSEFRELVELRGALFTDLLKHAEELQRLYGASVGTTTELAEVQKRLEPDEAIIGWISRGDELWSCILRSESAPRWVRLQNRTVAGGIPDVLHPGTIPTLDPEERVEALREHLHTPWRKPAKVEAERLLVPLLAELAGIRRLVMLPWPGLDGTPIETLVATLPPPRDQLVVSYAPSASMLAQLRTASGKSKQSIATGRLLAVGDPSSPKRGVDSSASLTPRSAYGSGALGSSFRSRSIDGAHRRERDRIEDGRIR
jgi:hypothetical protein